MKQQQGNTDEICCEPFNPSPWQEKTHVWEHKLFMCDSVRQILHIPLNMGRVITRMDSRLRAAGAQPAPKDYLMLSYDPSPWKSELYMTATKEVPGAAMKRLSGTFVSRVYDGPYKDVPKWIKIQEAYVTGRGLHSQKHYFYYTTCPKCAKRYHHNYVVMFTKVA
jgi:hypothetical protein